MSFLGMLLLYFCMNLAWLTKGAINIVEKGKKQKIDNFALSSSLRLVRRNFNQEECQASSSSCSIDPKLLQ